MQYCFYNYEKIYINDYVFNSIIMPIKRYEKIDIKIIKRSEPRIIRFFEIIYIFNYLTNLISMNKIKPKKLIGTTNIRNLLKTQKNF